MINKTAKSSNSIKINPTKGMPHLRGPLAVSLFSMILNTKQEKMICKRKLIKLTFTKFSLILSARSFVPNIS